MKMIKEEIHECNKDCIGDYQDCISEIESYLNAHPEMDEHRDAIRSIIEKFMCWITEMS